jgi:oxygen-dependent protoporphyrinogen oxidase
VERVIVIGAGIAGLSAAHRLNQAGRLVTVFEASAEVGGRIRSVRFHQHDIECGAQFLSTGYRYILPLFHSYGLRSRVRECAPFAAFQRGRQLHRARTQRPWTLLTGGTLRLPEYGKMALGSLPLIWRGRRIDPSDYSSLAALDDVDAAEWCAEKLGLAASAYFVEAMVHGFYFHRMRGSSRALIAALMAFSGEKTLAVAGGWQALPRAMAAPLDIHCAAAAEALTETADGVRVCINGEWHRADKVVLATPACVSRGLFAHPTPQERAVLDTGYAASIHIALALRPGWKAPPAIRGVHGVLFAPCQGGLVAALTMESGRMPGGDGEVLSAMLGNDAAQCWLDRSDAELIRAVVDELAAHFPGLHEAIVAAHLQRWPAAEPLSRVGRAKAVARYRATLPHDRRIVLAGDYLGSPWTDGAAETGMWAAAHLLQDGATTS